MNCIHAVMINGMNVCQDVMNEACLILLHNKSVFDR